MSDGPHDIALFPLQTVLFPGGLLPLRIFEPRYMQMVSACLRDGESFGVCLIREGKEVGAPAVPHSVGCLARIVQWDMQQLGVLSIVVRGERRFRILERRVERDGLARAQIELLAEEGDEAVSEESEVGVRLLRAIVDEGAGARIEQPLRFESASWVSARLAEILPLPPAMKQKLLETDAGDRRLDALCDFLRKQKVRSSA
ncbi:MAG TPA: LON peptidase substrate-binding domain-containing protein [Burkholderiales bacterium]|nr:LON peptidase substrate-binding domain-containing protein [Burkholderiales bacterium]